MSTHRYPGGVISATPPTATSAGAVGVWTLEEALRNKAAGNWPDGSGADPYFRNTTLLLHGDGTNGAQNNTFLDSSTNGFTITRNGNTTQGTFSPYVGPGCWSDFYATTSSGWQTPANSITSILGSTFSSSATFTVEAWIYPLSRHSGGGAVLGYVLGSLNLTGSNADWAWGPDSNGNLVLFWYQGGNQICKSTSIIPLNTWTHIALSVSSGSIKLFINGTLETTTGATTINLSAPALTYVSSGGYVYGGTTWQGFNGYVSNLRVIGKRAAYTTSFTPSTKPLVATTDTTLLTCQQNGFVDSSAASWTLTTTGGAQISKFSPFTLYENTPTSYSGYFDGTGDYLSLASGSALAFGTSDFTVELWVYFSSNNGTYNPFVRADGSGVFDFGYDASTSQLKYSGSASIIAASWTPVIGRWYHVALTRSSGSSRAFIDGTQVGTTATSDTNNYANTASRIGGSSFSGSHVMYGSISNVRVVKGSALYTSNFTPSTSPLTAISGTSLLTCQSTTFIDNSTNAFAITANGNARPRPANPFTDEQLGPFPYGADIYGGSAYFDGTGDYLTAPASNSNIWPGSGSFTIDYWLYLPANPSSGYYTHFSYGTSGSVLRVFHTAATAKIEVFSGATTILNPSWPTAGWNHFALVRNGTTLTLYINGAIAQSVTNSTDFSTGTLTVGGESASNPLLGYISNFRIVKGTAVYTAPFVPPTAPVTAVANTQLLLNATNAGILDNTTVNDLETGGGVQISTSVVKYGTGSIAYNGTNSYLTFKGGLGTYNGASVAGNGIFYVGNTFTIEAWIYPTTLVASTSYWNIILGDVNTTTVTSLWWTVGLNSASKPSIIWYDGATKSCLGGSTIPLNDWTHLAFVSTNGTLKIYVNGISETLTGTTAITLPSGTTGTLSSGVDRTRYWAGYLDELRVTNGVARYTTNFTPPGGPFNNF